MYKKLDVSAVREEKDIKQVAEKNTNIEISSKKGLCEESDRYYSRKFFYS